MEIWLANLQNPSYYIVLICSLVRFSSLLDYRIAKQVPPIGDKFVLSSLSIDKSVILRHFQVVGLFLTWFIVHVLISECILTF